MPRRLTSHERYAAQIRAEGRSCTPYRLGIAVGAAGDRLQSPYTPGSRGDHLFRQGVEYGRIEREVDAKARKLYEAMTANDPVIHCNRFPSWGELTGAQKWQWREQAMKELLA